MRPVRFYVLPQYDHPVSDEWTARFAQQIACGHSFVCHRRASVQLTSGGMLYTLFRAMSLPPSSGAVEPLADWLSGVATLLEEVAPPVAEVGPRANGWLFASTAVRPPQ